MSAGVAGWGGQADDVLGTAEGWDAFTIVRWHGVEAISEPYQYEITLQRAGASGPSDLDKLIDAGASFAIGQGGNVRMVHGILAEAEEIDRTTSFVLYRVLLVPHLWRARWRRRCRNFLHRTLRDIVSAVLENCSPVHPKGMGGLARFTTAQAADLSPSFATFSPPTASYRWDLKDPARVDEATAYPYVVQYNESDFVSRLLEGEGLSYYFEHGQSEVVFAITDKPGVSPMFDQSKTYDLRRLDRSGATNADELVRSYRDARRLRSRSVTVRDWDYTRSMRPLQAEAGTAPGDPDLTRHFEFPAGDEWIEDRPGVHPAEVRIQRYDAERAMREGTGTVRTMAPGYRFTLHDADDITGDAKLLAVRVETFATASAPTDTILEEEPFGFANTTGPLTAGYESRFVAIPEDVPFRPAMRTPKPRIHGVQSAVVTAEELAEGERPVIHADGLGRVRLRFPWDQRDDQNDKTPTSRWVRASQLWAGAGYGALYTPRVGHEVLVAYMQGDPDDPVIVGRVYNTRHRPPYDPAKDPTKSTIKSQSAEAKKEVDGFNELRFDDTAKKEEIYLHAQRNLNEVVLASHSTSVGGDQSNSVGHDQTNTVKGHREHTVLDYETVTVGDDRTTIFQANEHHKVSGFRDTTIGAYQTLAVGGFQTTTLGGYEMRAVSGFRKTTIGAGDELHVTGWHNVTVTGGDTLDVGSARSVKVGADYTVKTSGTYASEAGPAHTFKSAVASFDESAAFTVKAGSATLSMSSGIVTINNGAGASISLVGGLIVITAGASVVATAGGPVAICAGGPMNLTAGGDINGKAANIKLNG